MSSTNINLLGSIKLPIVIFLTLLSLSIIGRGIGYAVFDPAPFEHMAKVGVLAEGTVIGKDRENHATITYAYVIRGSEYRGTGHNIGNFSSIDQVQLGDRFAIYYDPDKPEMSVLGDPRDDLASQYTGILFLTIALPLVGIAPILAIYFAIKVSGGKTGD